MLFDIHTCFTCPFLLLCYHWCRFRFLDLLLGHLFQYALVRENSTINIILRYYGYHKSSDSIYVILNSVNQERPHETFLCLNANTKRTFFHKNTFYSTWLRTKYKTMTTKRVFSLLWYMVSSFEIYLVLNVKCSSYFCSRQVVLLILWKIEK